MRTNRRIKPTKFFILTIALVAVMMFVGCNTDAGETKSFFEAMRIEPAQVAAIEINGNVVSEDQKQLYLSLLSDLHLKAIYHFSDESEKAVDALIRATIATTMKNVSYDFMITTDTRMIIRDSYYEGNQDTIRKILELGGESRAFVQSVDSPAFRGESLEYELNDDLVRQLAELLKNTCGEVQLKYNSLTEIPLGSLYIDIYDKFGNHTTWIYVTENRVVMNDALYSAKLEDLKKLILFLRENRPNTYGIRIGAIF